MSSITRPMWPKLWIPVVVVAITSGPVRSQVEFASCFGYGKRIELTPLYPTYDHQKLYRKRRPGAPCSGQWDGAPNLLPGHTLVSFSDGHDVMPRGAPFPLGETIFTVLQFTVNGEATGAAGSTLYGLLQVSGGVRASGNKVVQAFFDSTSAPQIALVPGADCMVIPPTPDHEVDTLYWNDLGSANVFPTFMTFAQSDFATPTNVAICQPGDWIFRHRNPGVGPEPFISYCALGLVAEDIIDALCVNGSGDVVYSLAPGSPSLQIPGVVSQAGLDPAYQRTPGDLFAWYPDSVYPGWSDPTLPAGQLYLYCSYSMLELAPGDNLMALRAGDPGNRATFDGSYFPSSPYAAEDGPLLVNGSAGSYVRTVGVHVDWPFSVSFAPNPALGVPVHCTIYVHLGHAQSAGASMYDGVSLGFSITDPLTLPFATNIPEGASVIPSTGNLGPFQVGFTIPAALTIEYCTLQALYHWTPAGATQPVFHASNAVNLSVSRL